MAVKVEIPVPAICIYSFCSIELPKNRNTWSLTAVAVLSQIRILTGLRVFFCGNLKKKCMSGLEDKWAVA